MTNISRRKLYKTLENRSFTGRNTVPIRQTLRQPSAPRYIKHYTSENAIYSQSIFSKMRWGQYANVRRIERRPTKLL